jgi:hypothetical protein
MKSVISVGIALIIGFFIGQYKTSPTSTDLQYNIITKPLPDTLAECKKELVHYRQDKPELVGYQKGHEFIAEARLYERKFSKKFLLDQNRFFLNAGVSSEFYYGCSYIREFSFVNIQTGFFKSSESWLVFTGAGVSF